MRVAVATLGLLALGLTLPVSALSADRAGAGRLRVGPVVAMPSLSHQASSTPKARPGSQQLSYHGGLHSRGVQHHPKVYLVFWGSQWDKNDPYAAYEKGFFRGLYGAGDRWTSINSEFCDHVRTGAVDCRSPKNRVGRPNGSLVKGVWFDDAMPAVPTESFVSVGAGNDHTLQTEAQAVLRAAEHFGNTTPAKNVDVQYIINTPHMFNTVGFGVAYCAFHSYVDSDYGPLSFTNMPYITDFGLNCGQNSVNAGAAGTYDGLSIVVGHEFIETLTDPYPAFGWVDGSNQENADKCAWKDSGEGAMTNLHLSTGTFAVQGTWSNLPHNGTGGCVNRR